MNTQRIGVVGVLGVWVWVVDLTGGGGCGRMWGMMKTGDLFMGCGGGMLADLVLGHEVVFGMDV